MTMGKARLARIGLFVGFVGVLSPAMAGIEFRAATGSPYATAQNPVAMVTADFNGDGRADLATADYYGNGVSVFLGNASGGLDVVPGSPFSAIAHPSDIAAGDLNGDGHPDLVTLDNEPLQANQSGIPDRVVVLLGDGTGHFAAPSSFVLGPEPTAVAIADLNNDGDADLAVTNTVFLTDTYQQEIRIQPGLGDGTFDGANEVRLVTREAVYPCRDQPAQPCTIATPRSIRAADFNDDGNVDLVTANPGTKEVAVWLGNGAFGLTAAPGFPRAFTQFVQAVAVGDLNGDGAADIAVGHATFYSVSLLLGDGLGAFTLGAGSPVASQGAANAIDTGDFNGDGKVDVIASGDNGSVYAVNVLLGNGSGGIAPMPGSPVVVNGFSTAIVAADFNADGLDDLASASNNTNTVAALLAFKTPNPFTFVDQAGVAPASVRTSNPVVITGIDAPVTISITGGTYRVNNIGAFRSNPSTVNAGDSVRVRHTSSYDPLTSVHTTLTVGGVSDTFTSTTSDADINPDAFGFGPTLLRQPQGTLVESATITPAGYDAPAPVKALAGTEYSIDGAPFTAVAGTISPGSTLKVRHVTAGTANTIRKTGLKIGNVTGYFYTRTAR